MVPVIDQFVQERRTQLPGKEHTVYPAVESPVSLPGLHNLEGHSFPHLTLTVNTSIRCTH